MRNLKKFLALALAVMMTLSLMVTANAAIDTSAAVTDKDSITEEFKEAVAVLNGLKIITGYEDGTFRPDKSISRQEATALVYRLHSGDADNVKNNLYSTADNIAKFKDVDPNGAQQWSAGYIGYCANQEIIKGVGADRFNPTGNVTGYQMLAMVLRAIGYGQRGEYEGTGWQTRVATTATNLGMLKNIDDTNYAGTLSAPATRELVAEIVFQAALREQVIWNEAFGYVSKNDITGLALKSLGKENFQLDYTAYTTVDEWGRPGYYWYRGARLESDLSNVVTTISPKPEKSYTTTIRECDLAHDLGIASSADFDLYVNDNEPITENYLVVANDTTTKVGGQGRLTEVYRNLRNGKGGVDNRVVMVDTFLAKVTGVTTAKLDANNHVVLPATLTLAVYDQPQKPATPTTPNPTTSVVKNTGANNWDYSVGDMILLNAYTDHAYGFDANGTRANHTTNEVTRNQAAFETEQVPGGTLTQGTDAFVLHVADSKVAKQTTVYWNQEKHNVDGKDIPDQIDLFLDVAGTTTNSDFTWYFDDYENIIGIGDAVQSNYGVITSLYSSFNTADGATNGEAVARAHVKYANGTEGDVTIAQFVVYTLWKNQAGATAGHANPSKNNGMGTTARAAELKPVYDFSGTGSISGDTMTASAFPSGATYTPVNPVPANAYGKLNVSPVASINAAVEDGNTSPYYGIIKGNLFKFVTAGNGEVSAIEVAGVNGVTGGGTRNNDSIYVNNYNGKTATDANGGDTTDIAARTLYKNGGYLALASGYPTIRLDNNTQIMVLDDTTKNIAAYNGLSALPADVICKSGSEVDWTDFDGDGIAEVVYVTGETAGTVAYGLFYYNGGAGQWSDADKKGTLAGYVGGEAKVLTFTDKAEYDLVRSSQAYGGHLFGVRLNGDEVTNLMGRDNTNNDRFELLTDDAAVNITPAPNAAELVVGTNVKLSTGITNGVPSGLGTTTFVTGVQGGNGYTANTKAIWLQDAGSGATDVRWNEYTNQIWVDTDGDGVVDNGETTYSLTGASKQVGDLLAYLNVAGRKNDVTIVFEDNAVKSILEVYVATDPDHTTPGVPGSAIATKILSGPNAWVGSAANNNELTAKLVQAGRAGNTVVFDSGSATHASGVAGQTIYFPYVYTPNAQASLQVVDTTTGDIVWLEGMTHSATSPNMVGVMYFNITTTAPGGTETYGATPLKAGHTYSFSIYLNGTTLVSSGTFTAA